MPELSLFIKDEQISLEFEGFDWYEDWDKYLENLLGRYGVRVKGFPTNSPFLKNKQDITIEQSALNLKDVNVQDDFLNRLAQDLGFSTTWRQLQVTHSKKLWVEFRQEYEGEKHEGEKKLLIYTNGCENVHNLGKNQALAGILDLIIRYRKQLSPFFSDTEMYGSRFIFDIDHQRDIKVLFKNDHPIPDAQNSAIQALEIVWEEASDFINNLIFLSPDADLKRIRLEIANHQAMRYSYTRGISWLMYLEPYEFISSKFDVSTPLFSVKRRFNDFKNSLYL